MVSISVLKSGVGLQQLGDFKHGYILVSKKLQEFDGDRAKHREGRRP